MESGRLGIDTQLRGPVPQPVEQPRPAQRAGLDELQVRHPDRARPIRAGRAGSTPTTRVSAPIRRSIAARSS